MKQFDHIYVINLDKRKDRLEKVTKEFEKIGYDFERFSAVDGDEEDLFWEYNLIPGWNKNAAALSETTIRVLRDAKEKKYDSILICEDDLFFSENAKEYLEEMIMPIDGSWDMYSFGSIHIWNPTVVDSYNIRLNRSQCCHCYAVHSRVYDDYIKLLEYKDRPIDWVTTDYFQIHGRCYGSKIPIAFQKPDYSNIRKKEVYNKIK